MINKQYIFNKLNIVFLLGFSFYLFKIEGGFPIRKFIYDFAAWYFLFSIFLFISKRVVFSTLISAGIVNLILLCSFRKIDLMGAYLVSDDLVFLYQNPLFVLDFISLDVVVLLGLAVTLGFALIRYEPKSLRLSRSKFAIALVSAFAVFFMPTQEEYVYHIDRPSKTRALLHFAASFNESFGLTYPSSTPDSLRSCCAKASPTDLELSRESGDNKNIIVVLMESTFNVENIRQKSYPSAFAEFPTFPVTTYVVGGGTWVEEFAFLHGVPPPMYGRHYRAINTLGVGKLDGRIAQSLKDFGYKTKTFSIADRAFYGGVQFHTALGINDYFSSEDRTDYGTRFLGYTDDHILRDVTKNLASESRPSFVFVNTAINHSPHEMYQSKTSGCKDLPSVKCNILREYNDRERAFTTIMKDFLVRLESLDRHSIVVFFGDHIPAAINENFSDADFADQNKYKTIAFLYSTEQRRFVKLKEIFDCEPQNIEISDLDVVALKMAGLRSKYSDEKISNIQKTCRML